MFVHFIQKSISSQKLIQNLHNDQIGHGISFFGPFGTKRVIYCDSIASGRSLRIIENIILDKVLPFYANTHTTTSTTSNYTTKNRQESREIIRKAVNASSEDVLIFTGSGTTGAIHKLLNCLALDKLDQKPCAFISGQEHHSNLLPWKEAGCEMVTISHLENGAIDADDLEEMLKKERKLNPNRMILGLFPKASNVTGIINDDLKLTRIMHRYDGLAFWDFATAAPYVQIDMNPDRNCEKDAIFFSMHKFLGGPQTPGILVAKKSLFRNDVPHGAGGGTVTFVTKTDHLYTKDIVEREEGGTPAIVESIRAGLVMQLKQNIGSDFIEKKEKELVEIAHQRLQNNPNIVLLGPQNLPKLAIFSFLIKSPKSLGEGFLHYNFVCKVLNDLFGIQSRGGCACAGPYGSELLGFTEANLKSLLDLAEKEDQSAFAQVKPGFSRLNLAWSASDEEIDYVLEAVEIVSNEGWKLLPKYEFDPTNGEWTCKILPSSETQNEIKDGIPWKNLLQEARKSIRKVTESIEPLQVHQLAQIFNDNSTSLRWFPLPFEAQLNLLEDREFALKPLFEPKVLQ